MFTVTEAKNWLQQNKIMSALNPEVYRGLAQTTKLNIKKAPVHLHEKYNQKIDFYIKTAEALETIQRNR